MGNACQPLVSQESKMPCHIQRASAMDEHARGSNCYQGNKAWCQGEVGEWPNKAPQRQWHLCRAQLCQDLEDSIWEETIKCKVQSRLAFSHRPAERRWYKREVMGPNKETADRGVKSKGQWDWQCGKPKSHTLPGLQVLTWYRQPCIS